MNCINKAIFWLYYTERGVESNSSANKRVYHILLKCKKFLTKPHFFFLKEKERNYDISKYKKFLPKSRIAFQKQLKEKSDLKIGKKRQCDTFIVSTLRQSSTFVWFSSVWANGKHAIKSSRESLISCEMFYFYFYVGFFLWHQMIGACKSLNSNLFVHQSRHRSAP